MEDFNKQQLLVPPETSLERTLRTGKIDFMGLAIREAMPEMVAIFDDVIERPVHYYDKTKNLMPVASSLGYFMVRKAMRVLGEGTIDEIHETREALWPSFRQHIGYSFDPHGPSRAISDNTIYNMQRGMEQERAAYRLLMDAHKIPGSGYELNVLRSYGGLAAKALCEIVDTPNKVMMTSELRARFPDRERLRLLLRSLVDLQVIRIDPFRSTNEYDDGVPTDNAYAPYPTESPRCRTSEDSELMVLARYHAQRYDNLTASTDEIA
jgi:hypothetical protein